MPVSSTKRGKLSAIVRGSTFNFGKSNVIDVKVLNLDDSGPAGGGGGVIVKRKEDALTYSRTSQFNDFSKW